MLFHLYNCSRNNGAVKETDIGIFIYFMKQSVDTSVFPLYIHFSLTILTHLDAYLCVIVSVNFQKSICMCLHCVQYTRWYKDSLH
jgi:hypothetical protein